MLLLGAYKWHHLVESLPCGAYRLDFLFSLASVAICFEWGRWGQGDNGWLGLWPSWEANGSSCGGEVERFSGAVERRQRQKNKSSQQSTERTKHTHSAYSHNHNLANKQPDVEPRGAAPRG